MPQIEFFEKRIDTRVEIEAPAKIKILTEGDEAANMGYEKVSTRNISRGGVCMMIPYKVSTGNVIRVEIPVKDKSVRAFCEVQWCKQQDASYETGLSFIALKEEDMRLLDEYVRESENQRAM